MQPMWRRVSSGFVSCVVACSLLVNIPSRAVAQKDKASSTSSSAVSKLTPAQFRELAAEVAALYAKRENLLYRSIVFWLLTDAVSASPQEALAKLTSMIDVAQDKGYDGLEGLLLALLDRLARSDASSVKSDAKSQLARIPGKRKYQDVASPNMPIPLGVKGGLLNLDIRADAMRALLDRYVASKDVMDLRKLFDQGGTKQALCQVPAQKSAAGDTNPADAERKRYCELNKQAGGRGLGPAGSLGSLSVAGCFDSIREPDETDILLARAAALGTCRKELQAARPNRPSPYLAPAVVAAIELCAANAACAGAVVTAAAAVTVGVIAGVTAVVTAIANAWATLEKADRDRIIAAIEKRDDAVANVTKAENEKNDRNAELETLNVEAADLSQALRDQTAVVQNAAGTPAEDAEKAKQAKLKADLDAKNAAIKDKEKQVAEAETKKKAAEAELEAKKATLQAAKDMDESLKPELFSSPVCQEALFGTSPQKEAKELIEKGRDLGPVSNFAEAPPSEAAAEGFPLCGLDPKTRFNPAAKCRSAVLCKPGSVPDENCGCSPTAGKMTLQDLLSSNLHCVAVRCSDGTIPQGQNCMCESPQGKEPTEVPQPKPSPTAVNTWFYPLGPGGIGGIRIPGVPGSPK